MGDTRGFLKIKRRVAGSRPVCERVKDYKSVSLLRSDTESRDQASRCMDCSTSFCNWGCPIGNYIPEWNDLVFKGQWEKALELLDGTNNLPEITGRLCPAPCEYSCVLGINDDPVSIRENELAIIEYGFTHGLIKARPPLKRTGKKVAVIGSGPAGLACAAQLNKAGHNVTTFERDNKIGGILRYGIPDFKLEKWILDRRINLLRQGGIEFRTDVHAGADYPAQKLLHDFDAVCLTGGSRSPRDLKIEGRDLEGIYFAMDYLTQANRIAAGENIPGDKLIDAKGKNVVVIGGGDTGADCVGTAHRQGAKCVIQIEVLSEPPGCRTEDYPWPKYPMLLKTSTSHEEGGERHWSVLTRKFTGKNGRIAKLSCAKVEFVKQNGAACPAMKEIPGTEFEIDADMAVLAVGFVSPEHNGLLNELGLEFDGRGNVKTDGQYMTSVKGVFSAGDMRRGQSLIVWAVLEGRLAARAVDIYLMGNSDLPNI